MYEILFKFLSFSPGPSWLILMFVPANRMAMRYFDAHLFLLATIFTFLTIPVVPDLLPVIAQPTLAGIQKFIETSAGTVGVWNHMILGDLWIGRWVVHDALKLGIKAYVRISILFVIIFFGPMGLFGYLLYRWLVAKKYPLTAPADGI